MPDRPDPSDASDASISPDRSEPIPPGAPPPPPPEPAAPVAEGEPSVGEPSVGEPSAAEPSAAEPSADSADAAPEQGAGSGADASDAEPGASELEEGRPGRRGKAAEPKVIPPPLERLSGAIEALLLASGESLSADRIRDVLGLPSSLHVREALDGIRARWRAAELPVELQDVAGGHRVVTRPEYAEYVRRLWRRPSGDRLSQTLLETLSIVAYRQPAARAEIERIRGVQCGESLRGLLERRLIKVAGRSDQPGRPLLYATTAKFLEVFALAGLEDLPNAKDLTRL